MMNLNSFIDVTFVTPSIATYKSTLKEKELNHCEKLKTEHVIEFPSPHFIDII